MALPSMLSSHLCLLVLNCFLGASASVKGASTTATTNGGEGDSSVLAFSDDALDQDALSQHMNKLYEKYSKENRLREGNTVRSFRASQDSSDRRTVYRLNLTTLADSEVIISATFHFLLQRRPHPKPWFLCKNFKKNFKKVFKNSPPPPPCIQPSIIHPPALSISLLLRSVPQGSGVEFGSMGPLLGNVTFNPHRRGAWQLKDLTQVIKEARDKGHDVLSLEIDQSDQSEESLVFFFASGETPYLILYANDVALDEPNSVASSLQRYDPFSEAGEKRQHSTSKGRARRDVSTQADSIQSNELPEVDYYGPGVYKKEEIWESTWYLALKPKIPKSGKNFKKQKSHEDKGVEQVKAAHDKEERLVFIEGDGTTIKVGDTTVKNHKNSRTSTVPDGQKLILAPHDKEEFPALKQNGEGTSHDSSLKNHKDNSRKQERRNEGKDALKKPKLSGGSLSPLLRFDEQTMRAARRRQWAETQQRGCSRRNLRVDFADIGWSEWVIAPKAFEAFYCAGTCGFPMQKVTRPSNHATIQSIVRAVGIIPGVPEPCCVPEKMNPLAVLYRDESRNPVLKVYPNMSVQSCSCR